MRRLVNKGEYEVDIPKLSSDWDWDRALEMGIETTPVPGDDSIMPGATTHPTTTKHPQLLTMKKCSDKKVPFVKIS